MFCTHTVDNLESQGSAIVSSATSASQAQIIKDWKVLFMHESELHFLALVLLQRLHVNLQMQIYCVDLQQSVLCLTHIRMHFSILYVTRNLLKLSLIIWFVTNEIEDLECASY